MLVSNNRRSLENDTGKYQSFIFNFYPHFIYFFVESDKSKLDTLPEEKIHSINPDYKKVYKEWKPVQNTDIAGTIKAIEGKFCFTMIVGQEFQDNNHRIFMQIHKSTVYVTTIQHVSTILHNFVEF